MKKRILALMLSVALTCSSVTVAFAAGEEVGGDGSIENVEEENCGETIGENDENALDDPAAVTVSETNDADTGDTDTGNTGINSTDSEEAGGETTDDGNAGTEGVPVQDENALNSAATVSTVLESGTCGDNLTWILTDDLTLTISGNGPMDTSDGAPWGDWGIVDVIIEGGVTSIGDNAFDSCYLLSNVTIPDSVTSIGDRAFYFCPELQSVTIPESVTSIGSEAFYECRSLTEIRLPDSVANIGTGTFEGCTDLTNITLSNSLKTIPEWAFAYCTGLTEIVIPEGVTTIEDYAFVWCSSLAKVTIPDSVTSIGYGAFEETPWAESALDDDGFLIINNILLESTIDEESITIPDNVTSISDYVFRAKENLKQVSVPDHVSSIGDWAFGSSPNLTDVNIPSSLTKIQYSTFSGCESLASVDIPSSVTTIEGYAFYRTGMTSVTVPASVTSIEEYALGYTRELNSQGRRVSVPVEGFTIYGYTGSAAETYANDNSFAFVALDAAGLAIVADKTDEVYIKGSGTGATIYCTGDLKKFVSVEMDGKVIGPSNYTVADGSTVLTFSSAYLDTLATGKHTVTLNYIDGSISTTLTILEKDDAGVAGGGSGSGAGNGADGSGTNTASSRAAKTGDQTSGVLWLVLGLGSAVICAAVLIKRKKSA